MTKIGRYIRTTWARSANLGHRPNVDKPKPIRTGSAGSSGKRGSGSRDQACHSERSREATEARNRSRPGRGLYRDDWIPRLRASARARNDLQRPNTLLNTPPLPLWMPGRLIQAGAASPIPPLPGERSMLHGRRVASAMVGATLIVPPGRLPSRKRTCSRSTTCRIRIRPSKAGRSCPDGRAWGSTSAVAIDPDGRGDLGRRALRRQRVRRVGAAIGLPVRRDRRRREIVRRRADPLAARHRRRSRGQRLGHGLRLHARPQCHAAEPAGQAIRSSSSAPTASCS